MSQAAHWVRYRTLALLLLFLSNVLYCPRTFAQSALATARLTINGDVEKPLSLSVEDVRQLSRKTLKVTNPHKKEETYEGVLVTELLKRAGVPLGAQLRGATMATYIQADAGDGYRVVFSLAELDADFQDSDVIVADMMDGAPLDDKVGPFRLIAPRDKKTGSLGENVAVADCSPNTEVVLLLSRWLEFILLEYFLRLISREKIQETLCLSRFLRTFQNGDRIDHQRMRILRCSCGDADLR